MKIRLLACLCAACFLWMGAAKKPIAYLRCYVQLFPNAGMKQEDVIPVQLTNPRSTIFVSKIPDLAETDMSRLEVLGNGKTMIVFTDEGKKKLAALTQSSLESIFVVVCNGRVVYAPLVDTVITSGKLLIPEGISPQEADELNELIKTGKITPPTPEAPKRKPIRHSTRGAAVREMNEHPGE